jgi:ABC-type phosphate transport system ATPase subunit
LILDKISIEHLNLYYGSFQALKDVNLEVPAQEITALIARPDAANPPCSRHSTE